jgi:hypothetical protein
MAKAKIFAPAIATQIGMPSFFLDHLALVKIPAYRESTVASSDQAYPVILFSHGWNGFNAQNTSQALELASHGYIVIGIQHTYGASSQSSTMEQWRKTIHLPYPLARPLKNTKPPRISSAINGQVIWASL